MEAVTKSRIANPVKSITSKLRTSKLSLSKFSRNQKQAIIIGIGIALFPIHNKWLADVTSVNGEATLFLPVFGTVIWILATLFFIRDNWQKLDWGDKRVYVPLLVIVAAMGLSGITADSLMDKVSPLLMGASLFALYLVARVLGKDMFLPLAVGAGIAALAVIIHGLMYPGVVTGGFIFERNYDVVVGYVMLGTALFFYRWQIPLSILALVAMFFTGSPEAVFVIGVLVIVMLVRRDWSKKMLIPIGILVCVAGLWFASGNGTALYRYAEQVARSNPVVQSTEEAWGVTANTSLGYRYVKAAQAMTNLKPLGEGYNLTDFGSLFMVHNVPLVIVQQLGYPGILAGLAWLWVSIWCLVKTKWKYLFILILSLSVFDHYVWTQLAPLWPAIVGASTASDIKSDLMFRKGA